MKYLRKEITYSFMFDSFHISLKVLCSLNFFKMRISEEFWNYKFYDSLLFLNKSGLKFFQKLHYYIFVCVEVTFIIPLFQLAQSPFKATRKHDTLNDDVAS